MRLENSNFQDPAYMQVYMLIPKFSQEPTLGEKKKRNHRVDTAFFLFKNACVHTYDNATGQADDMQASFHAETEKSII